MADAVPTLPSAVSDDVDANTDVSLTTAPSEPEEEQTNSVIGVLRVAYGDGYHRKMLWFNGDDGALLQPEDVQFTPTIRITNRRQPPPEVQPTEKKNQQIEEDEKEDTVDTMQQKQQQQQQQQRKLTSFDEVIVPGLYTLTLSSCEATNADNEVYSFTILDESWCSCLWLITILHLSQRTPMPQQQRRPLISTKRPNCTGG